MFYNINTNSSSADGLKAILPYGRCGCGGSSSEDRHFCWDGLWVIKAHHFFCDSLAMPALNE